ncbi:MAG: hypothetical protein V7631_4607 [Massilia sp.]|jgi:hypothetical protein
MNSLPEQFSAARQTQIDNSFKLMRSFSDGVLERASRVLALQLDASRATVEQSSSAMRQLLALRDPRDLLALGSQSQQHLRTMFDYSRELLSIVAGINATPLPSYSVDTPVLNAPAALETVPRPETAAVETAAVDAATQVASEAFERTGSDTASAAAAAASAAVSAPESIERAVDDAASAEAQTASASAAQAASGADVVLPADAAAEAIPVVTSDIAPDAEPTPIARATSEALDIPVAPPHPVAASVPVEVAVEIELPKVEPVDAVPPPVAPAAVRPAETRGTKGRRKQNG